MNNLNKFFKITTKQGSSVLPHNITDNPSSTVNCWPTNPCSLWPDNDVTENENVNTNKETKDELNIDVGSVFHELRILSHIISSSLHCLYQYPWDHRCSSLLVLQQNNTILAFSLYPPLFSITVMVENGMKSEDWSTW